MSGDVQPRKRKEKRRKKDELGIEELRGTAAVFGEGDVLIHSYHEHGTGGHWCAKIIFFSLLAVLVTLIGLIILENRGLSELEANAVESRYSGVLNGWIEDAPDDDHHDEHTLELKHHDYKKIHDDDDDDEHRVSELEHNEDDDHSEEHMHEDEEENSGIDDDADEETEESDNGDDDQDDNNNYGSEEEDVEAYDNEDDQNFEYKKYYKRDIYGQSDNDFQEERDDDLEEDLKNDIEDDDDDDDIDENKSDEIRKINDNYENNDIEQNLRDYEDDIDENFDTYDEDNEIEDNDENAVEDGEEEIEKIEREVLDEEELPVSDEDKEDFKEDENEDESSFEDEDMTVLPVVEQITVPPGKPFVELEDETSSEKPTNTLDEEEEYEKRQEQLRLEKEESSSKMWLKLVVGGALLVATHAVIRRSTAPRDTQENEANARQEETPSVTDRRMTLIPNEPTPLLPAYEPPHEERVKKIFSDTKTVKSVPIQKQESEEDQEVSEKFETEEVTTEKATNDVLDKEMYSDDDEEVEDEEVIDEKKEYPKEISLDDNKDQEESENEEVPDDVEIIDDEQIEEEIEEEVEDEEEISDVDDAELLSRLEAKYGRLPEPDRPESKHKDSGNNVEDEWPGEPSEPYWRQQLDYAEQEIRQGEWAAANNRLVVAELQGSGRARWLAARSLDAEAEKRRDNKLLTRAISAYLHLLKMNEQLSDSKLLEVTARALDRIQFRGTYLSAEPVYRMLIRRFPNDVSYRNNLTISFLMANRADLAGSVLKETLKIWPNDRVALAHYGFVLKTQYNKLEEAVTLFRKALENDTGPACEPRFYYHLGDALLLLGRFEEAHEVHKRGAKHGHFLSPVQRSLYNVERLQSRPWWRVDETPYAKLARALEKSWKEILKEGEAARALYEKEKEGLKEKGEWSQLDLFVRGQEIPGRCKRAPVTCSIVKAEPAAANCRRGQIKFSSMEPGTHVRPHVGPTNCRLRMHLGLSNTKDTYIRVDQETRQWQTGKVLLFDDSFEHEVWHNGTGTRLVLIVDVWHPHLTPAERRQLPAI